MSNERKYAPTVTAMFETKSGNYMSRPIDEDMIREIATALQTKITTEFADNLVKKVFFLRKSREPNKTGRHTYYLDIVDPVTFSQTNTNSDL